MTVRKHNIYIYITYIYILIGGKLLQNALFLRGVGRGRTRIDDYYILLSQHFPNFTTTSTN